MTVLAGHRTRPQLALVRGWLPVLGLIVLVPVLVLVGAPGWQPIRVLAAAFTAWLALWSAMRATGRIRNVRGTIAASATIWLVSELLRLGNLMGDDAVLLAQVSVAGIVLCAAGTYVAVARGRLSKADELALYLDAAIMALALTATTLVVGERFVVDDTGLEILIHAAFFVSILASTFLLDITTRVPLRAVGNWEILLGLALGAVGYLGLLVPGVPQLGQSALNLTVALGVLVVGHGTARWTADEDDRPRYLRIAGWLRRLLPLTCVALAGVLAIGLVTQPEQLSVPLRAAAAVTLVAVVILAIARQTVLLADRERVIERERRLADELLVAEAQYRSVVERVPGVVYVAEAGQHGRWHFVSPKIEQLMGFTAEEWTADPKLWIERMHPADRERMILAELSDTERENEQGRWEYRLIARDGRVVWVIDDEAVISRDADGHPTMVQGILVDISDRKRLEDQLRHQALHDPLTGLPNRVLFVDRLAHALVRRHNGMDELAVMFVDLDDFKSINDTLGHAAGDELLRLVAKRLPSVLRAEDTACRMGGDEFAFLLEDADRERAEIIAARILEALASPFDFGGRGVTLSASIGIATRRTAVDGTRSGDVADEILRDADTAMYAAKALGKGQVQTFDRGMNEPIARRRELQNTLDRAIENGELFLEYQSIVDMRDGSTVGVEALVRWQHPQLGRLLPGEFIGLAETTGHIDKVGEFVLRRAAEEMANRPLLLSVNVSAHQLTTGGLPDLVRDVLAATGLPATRLMLELTESALAGSGAGAEAELQAIRSLGVRFALDDFGSGYSSLEYLGRLPVDVLKIDRSLVTSAHLDHQRREVLRAIAHIARKLGLSTIVEGVELEAQRATLLDLGFRQAQGFLFSEPMRLADALDSTGRSRARAS
ncbi:MAG TPA: EAL domain-containing protein [Candidatus Limnocylindria bacterium]|nr:EAL domain-containing protein [Candidatus Limnocylindria bacterium]